MHATRSPLYTYKKHDTHHRPHNSLSRAAHLARLCLSRAAALPSGGRRRAVPQRTRRTRLHAHLPSPCLLIDNTQCDASALACTRHALSPHAPIHIPSPAIHLHHLRELASISGSRRTPSGATLRTPHSKPFCMRLVPPCPFSFTRSPRRRPHRRGGQRRPRRQRRRRPT